MSPRIFTQRFELRLLTAENATDQYLSWLQNETAQEYITAATKTKKIADLQDYINERTNRDDILFFGIFIKDSSLHIGNIKFEPIDSKEGYAIMGILIGEESFRGKGVMAEVLCACAWWLRVNRAINYILLGVHSGNQAALRAYKKFGFYETKSPFVLKSSAEHIVMRKDIFKDES